MYPNNAFITLTYDDDHLKSDRLNYEDFQLFMKRLRKAQDEPIGFFCTGEYGDRNKRPHWHAIVFNWAPKDAVYKYSNDRGDKVYESQILTNLWGKGLCESGSVSFESAGYCARYAAKKLIHGADGDHEYEPISKKSNKHAIGKRWLEKFWPDVFSYGHIVLPNGSTCSIPRYYEKWFKEHHPEQWLGYVTKTKLHKMSLASAKSQQEKVDLWNTNERRSHAGRLRGEFRPFAPTPNQVRSLITKAKFQLLQERLKL